jgi:hypothetical protein
MNAPQIHLAFLHFPIVLAVFSLGWLLASFLLKNANGVRSGLFVQVLAGLSAIPAYFSGEEAEEAVEKFVWFDEAIFDLHEDAALFAMAALLLGAAIALAALILQKKKNLSARHPLHAAAVLAGLVSCILILRTGHLGGQIRHTEIRSTPGECSSASDSGSASCSATTPSHSISEDESE